jgi:predicted lipoprotein with Yx(FWY)xxD motif
MRHPANASHRGIAIGVLSAALLFAAGCDHRDASTTLPANADTGSADAVGPSATNVPSDTTLPATEAPEGTTGTSLTVATAEGVEGSYIADSAGNAVYFLEGDTDGSKCVDACTKVWMPVLVTSATPSAAPGLQAGMVGVVQRADGSSQASYHQHPLYRYSADSGAGSTAGKGVEDQWGHWYLLTPAGEELEGMDSEVTMQPGNSVGSG